MWSQQVCLPPDFIHGPEKPICSRVDCTSCRVFPALGAATMVIRERERGDVRHQYECHVFSDSHFGAQRRNEPRRPRTLNIAALSHGVGSITQLAVIFF